MKLVKANLNGWGFGLVVGSSTVNGIPVWATVIFGPWRWNLEK